MWGWRKCAAFAARRQFGLYVLLSKADESVVAVAERMQGLQRFAENKGVLASGGDAARGARRDGVRGSERISPRARKKAEKLRRKMLIKNRSLVKQISNNNNNNNNEIPANTSPRY